MKQGSTGAWVAMGLGVLYFLLPLIATFEFSLRLRRGEYSFDAYRSALGSGEFQSAFLYSATLAIVTIVIAIVIVVPTAYWIQFKLSWLRGVVEYITLLPLVIPAIVLVFGYIKLFNTESWLPLTGSAFGSDVLLTLGYVGLGLPYMYRSVEAGMRALDVKTLTEAAQIQGAGIGTVLFRVILPNLRGSLLSGAFLTFAIVIGDFTYASLLNRPTFGPYLQRVGAARAYEPAALAIMAFAITWGCMGVIQIVGQGGRASRARS